MIRHLLFALAIALLTFACGAAPENEEHVDATEQGICPNPGPLWATSKRLFMRTAHPPVFVGSNCVAGFPAPSFPSTVSWFNLPVQWNYEWPWTPPNSDSDWNQQPPRWTSEWINANEPNWWERAPEHYCAPYVERITAEWRLTEISPLPRKMRHVNTVHWYPDDGGKWDYSLPAPGRSTGYNYGHGTYDRTTTLASGASCWQVWQFKWESRN